MKLLTQKEVDALRFVTSGAKSSKIFDEIRKLEIGQSLFIKKDEWVPKTPPSVTIAGTFRNQRAHTIRLLLDKSGWVVTRLEDKKPT